MKKPFLKKPHTDSVLVGRAKRDKEKFEAIYKKYFARVHRYVSLRVQGSPDVAEDVTQETFVRAFGRLPQFQIRGYSYLSYLLRIAHNLLIIHYRRKKPTLLSGEEKELVDQKENLETSVAQKFEDARVQNTIARLPALEQRLLALRYKEQLSLREIAQRVEKSENAVKVALSRARKRLKGELKNQEKRLDSQDVNTSTRGRRKRGVKGRR